MLESPRGLRVIVILAITLCIVASLTGAKAGQDKNGALRIAVVDLGRLRAEYNYTTMAEGELKKKQDDFSVIARTMQQNPLLSDKEQGELVEIAIAKNTAAGLSDAQKAREKQLSDQSKALLEEFETLRNKKVGDVTPQDNTRLTQLMKMASDTDVRLADKKKKSEDDLQKQYSTAMTKLTTDVRESIAKVAKDKGFNLVFSNDVALYAENDITSDVVSLLNKKK